MKSELPELWNDKCAWQCVHHPEIGYSIAYDTKEFLIQAIIDDLLSAFFDDCAEIPWIDFIRFIPDHAWVSSKEDVKLEGVIYDKIIDKIASSRKNKAYLITNLQDLVLDVLTDPVVKSVATIDGDVIRLIADRAHLQAAMDIAGVWFDGYEIPKGTDAIRLSEKGEKMLNELGVEGVVATLAPILEAEIYNNHN